MTTGEIAQLAADGGTTVEVFVQVAIGSPGASLRERKIEVEIEPLEVLRLETAEDNLIPRDGNLRAFPPWSLYVFEDVKIL
jgi:hypothetical protein